ncbi:MAG: NAD(P)-dependent oxidoreductase [Bryobacteraceae bacterium]|jgi:glutamate synthase (NADPH/NADH) small chain
MMRNPVPGLTAEEFAERFAEIHPAFAPQAAWVEASRCLYCFDAPCTAACPTHIDVPKFIKKIATHNLRGSALTILDVNILGLSCSRVCPVDVLCEGACVLHRYNKQPIEIGRLQRHAMDHFYSHHPSIPVPEAGEKRVACVGAGPASLACAAELRRRGLAVTVFDRNPMAGGLNTYGIAEYKLRPADSLKEVELVLSMGAEFRLGVEIGDDIDSLEREFDAIFIGVGLGPTHRLNLPGDDLPGVVDALRFIADYKTGSTPVGRHVAVIGAGNTAIDAATAARRLGAERVHILYRRSEAEMPAFKYEYELAKLDRIEFHWQTRPLRIHGSRVVESIECDGPYGSFHITCDMIVPAIGQSRLVEFLERVRGVEVRAGHVIVQPETGQTANPKYFAGGDCVNGGREVVDAVAGGKRAAIGIAEFLGVHHG